MAGHFGIQKTLELVTRHYWWPHVRNFVKEYVRTCYVCCQSKMPRHHPFGLLHPLPIPDGPWKHLMEALKVSCKLSSSYHPQADGQTEQTNQTLKQ